MRYGKVCARAQVRVVKCLDQQREARRRFGMRSGTVTPNLLPISQ